MAFRVNGWYWASLSNNQAPLPPSPQLLKCQWNFLKCKGGNFKCHLNIRKLRPCAYILGFIELPYFGSEQFRKIYLVERICICIWIDVFVFESKLNKIYVFEKSKFLYLYLIKRIWPQPCELFSHSAVVLFNYCAPSGERHKLQCN